MASVDAGVHADVVDNTVSIEAQAKMLLRYMLDRLWEWDRGELERIVSTQWHGSGYLTHLVWGDLNQVAAPLRALFNLIGSGLAEVHWQTCRVAGYSFASGAVRPCNRGVHPLGEASVKKKNTVPLIGLSVPILFY